MLNFNLIYSPGTARYFRLFTLSLLKHTHDCTFRLVANGCTPFENYLLKDLCANYTRMQFYQFPSVEQVPLGQVLEHMQSLERSDYFCHIDSDVLAVANFVSDFTPLLDDYSVISAGRNVWMLAHETELPQGTDEIYGRHNRTASGLYLGGTYCVVYNNRVLTTLLESLDPLFHVWDKLTWGQIPQRYQKVLDSYSLRVERYDTSKVLYILLQWQGHRLTHLDLPSISHVGGFSIYQDFGIPDESFPLHFQRRYAICVHLSKVFDCLFHNHPLPPLPEIHPPEIAERLANVIVHLQSLYTEFGDELLAAEKAYQAISRSSEAETRLRQIENSWGWRTILRLHAARERIIPPGTTRENVYMRLRNSLIK